MGPSGYRRPKKTPRSVVFADRAAKHVITVGGIFVIVAVMGILVYLVEETLPLFGGGVLRSQESYQLQTGGGPDLVMAVDEYRTVAIEIGADGELSAFHVPTGTPLEVPAFPLGDASPTAFGASPDREHVAFGFADGTVRFGQARFAAEVLLAQALPGGLRALGEGAHTDGVSVYAPIPGDQVRRISVEVTLDDPLPVASAPITALDYRMGGSAERPTRAFVAVDAARGVAVHLAESQRNLMTGQVRVTTSTANLPDLSRGEPVLRVLLTEKGDQVFVARPTGFVERYNVKDFSRPFLAERVRLTPPGEDLTAISFLAGEGSLVAGSSAGSVVVAFPVNRPGANAPDGVELVQARSLAPHRGAVVRVLPALNGRTFVTADASGELWLRHATSGKTLLRFQAAAAGEDYRGIALAPRADGLVAVRRDGAAQFWDFDVPHPETSWRTLFGEVWYEGYDAPSYTWQSTGGTDQFESKLSLVPLIFGTLKGTLYSMLFAIPIALLAAIYTSEFLHHRVRGVVKPMMEMMASLPSVVLGFVAALVLAPVVETWVAGVLIGFLAIPATLLACAYSWQFLPVRVSNRLSGLPKLFLMVGGVVLGGALAYLVGPALERGLFGGDFKVWLSGQGDDATAFLFLLLLPLSFLIAGFVLSRLGGLRLRALMRRWGGGRAAALDLLRWVATVGLAAAVSWTLARMLGASGLDPRGTFVGTYAQRNTLVIAFAMGFAVIPIIYTLAEDALNAVPEHLRSASLGCGATPWQTALWIILPTAMSGVFSAVMIGMGRAVGETMIVVMAAGNTPIIDLNLFNGLRALSANIAVELPEAVKGGTLYRTLFLSALVLFAMTFVINTVAEVVRQRFRRRSLAL
ncbi:MAG: ABC transporter permease subunit [Deferrisomatales bacterium]